MTILRHHAGQPTSRTGTIRHVEDDGTIIRLSIEVGAHIRSTLVSDIRVLDAVQQHVHAADAQHRVVEVEAVEHPVVEVLATLRVVQDVRVALAQVLARRDKEPGCAAGRIADDVRRLRRQQAKASSNKPMLTVIAGVDGENR